MTLAAGARLGPYEIVSPLGAGGMGEVYRARDTKLNRDVAIKVLLPAVANDPDRLARFSREAQVLASLNHPNIAQIFGLEDSGDVRALVMELVEGPTLAERIQPSALGPRPSGGLPLNDALNIARQIADALEAAHEQGIIHRDLKPANIKVRSDGTVKVLDFGLAKALEPGSASLSGERGSAGVTASPTITTPAMMTGVGIILGTAAYMSPEQARGKTVDRRADIWAFGCVLFEVLTGQRAFDGDDASITLAGVLKDDPNWSALPVDTPTHIRTLLRRCLQKDPQRRLPHIGIARIEIDEGASATTTSGADGAEGSPERLALQKAAGARGLRPSVVIVVALLGAGLAGVVTWALMRSTPTVVQTVRFTATLPADLVLSTGALDRDVAISPDGTRLVYRSGNSQTSELHVRAIDQLESMQLRGITGARWPFISSDSHWIGFSSQSVAGAGAFELKKVSMTGGPPIALCRIQGQLWGASWGAGDAIVFATTDRTTGLLRVPAGGGDPAVLTRPDPQQGEADHVLPFVLPGGRAVLFTIVPRANVVDNYQIAALDLETGQRKTLIRGGSHAEYVDAAPASGAGYLVYAAAGTLRAVRFDPVRLAVLSDPVPVVEQVRTKVNGTANFSLSRIGALVYVAGGVGSSIAPRTLVWVDRQGHEAGIAAPPRTYNYPRLSPDGTKIALDVRDQELDIWMWDLAHATLTRLTFDPAQDTYPVWTPDGKRIMFNSQRSESEGIYLQQADGTGRVEPLMKGPEALVPYSVTPDGKQIVARTGALDVNDLALVHLEGTPRTEPLIHTPFNESNGEISPDGRWLAYQSNESGPNEIYVRPFPNVEGGRWQVSTGGGQQPLWARNGRELFYSDPGTQVLMSVPVETSASFSSGTPAKVFDTQPYFIGFLGRPYDVSSDGRKFLMIKNAAATGDRLTSQTSGSITVVLNWLEELKARVPSR